MKAGLKVKKCKLITGLTVTTIIILLIFGTILKIPIGLSSGDGNNSLSLSSSRAAAVQQGTSQWQAEVVMSSEDKISGVAIGNLDPTREGNEVVSVDGIGRVVLTHRGTSGTWDRQLLWQGQGELITPVIGDFYPGHDGKELLVVGMAIGEEGEGAGQATMIYGSGDNWKAVVIYINSDSMLHGAAVGELDPTRDGLEVIVMSFGFDVKMLTWNGTGESNWTATQIWHGEGKVRKGVIDDIDPSHTGNELAVVDKSGNCTMIYGSGTNWTAKTLWKDPGNPGLARITFGDADSTKPGKEVVVGGDSSNVGIIWRTGDNWTGEVIFTDTDSIRGVGIGDVDPTNYGNEILVFGYSKKVTLLTSSGSTWKARTIFMDTGRSHDLAIGDLDPTQAGSEIVIGGYSKNVTMIHVSPWFYNVLYSGLDKFSGVTIGDLDPTRYGNEVVGVDGIGRVILIYRGTTGAWEHQQLWQGQGELITPVIGDFYPGHDGKELLVVGMAMGPEGEGAGQATMIYGSGDNWKAVVIYINSDSMLHGAAVGELDPTRDGLEVIVMSFGFDVKMLTWNGTGEADWSAVQIWHAEGKVRKGVIDDIDPLREGNELVVVDKSGNCTVIYGSGNNWTAKTLWKDPGTPGLARIAFGDADRTNPGKEIVVGGDSKNVGIIRRVGDNWEGEVIFTDTDAIRGVGIGDVDPTNYGNEILVFGYSTKVTVLTGSGSTWQSKTIFIDDGRAHDLALGEFDPLHDGQEIVIGGYSKNVTMIFNNQLLSKPDFSLYAYPMTQTANSEGEVKFVIGALSTSGFNDPVTMKLDNLPATYSAELYPGTIIPDASTTLTIKVPITNKNSEHKIRVNATSSTIYHILELQLNVLGDTTPPAIKATYPANNAEGIPAQSPIVIWFTEPINSQTLTAAVVSIIEDESKKEYSGTIKYDQESSMMTISNIKEKTDTTKGLPAEKLIKVTLETSIADLAGNNLANKYQFEYLTGPEEKPATGVLEIKSSYPKSGSANVPINSPIMVRFSMPIDESTLNWNNIELSSMDGTKYTGTISYDPDSLILTISDIKPVGGTEEGFMDNTKITLKLTTKIKTAAGMSLSSVYSTDFETGKKTIEEDSEDDDLKNERDMYQIGLVLTIIIIILLLLALARKGTSTEKRQPSGRERVSELSEETEEEEEEAEQEQEQEREQEQEQDEEAEEEQESEDEDKAEEPKKPKLTHTKTKVRKMKMKNG